MKCEDVSEITVVVLGPEMSVRTSIQQLCRDADSLASPEHGSFDDSIHAEFLCDIAERPVDTFVLHRRGA